jgi:phage-related protein
MSVKAIVEIIGDASGLSDELNKSEKGMGSFGDKLGGSAIKVAAFAGAAGIAVGAIAEMTMAASADRDEQAKLELAIRNAGAATGDYNAIVDEAITKGQERAFSDSESRDALQSLVTATGDVTSATDLLTSAQDIARFANVDLATAADAVAKAQAGQAGPLAKLIPGLDKAGTASDVLAAATAQAAGSADLYAASAEGMQARAGDSLGELSETIGSVFLPILDAVIPALLPIVEALGTLVKAILPILIPLVKILAAALGIVANVLSTVVGWLAKLIDFLSQAIGKVGDFLAKINPLKDFKLPSLPFLSSTGASSSAQTASTRAGSPSTSSLSPTINVYTTGDGIEAEQAVVRALRRVTRINGGVIPAAPGWST